LDFGRYALGGFATVAVLAACGGSQPPINASYAIETVVQNRSVGRLTASAPEPNLRVADKPDYKVSGPLLFVTNSDPEYTPVTIYDAKLSNPKPIATITKGLFETAGVCVDNDGTLYVVTGENSIREYALGKTKPFRIITRGLWTPNFCAIDTAGNLWVTNLSGRNATEYLKGKVKPHFIIKDGLTNPDGIAIDQHGNVYVGNLVPSGSSNVQVYPPGRKKPIRTITNGITWPVGIAVDERGALYVTNDATCNIEVYLPGQSRPYRTITRNIDGATDVAFAKNGSMYEVNTGEQNCVSNGPWPVILEFRPGKMTPSKRTISQGLHNPIGVAYYPPLLP